MDVEYKLSVEDAEFLNIKYNTKERTIEHVKNYGNDLYVMVSEDILKNYGVVVKDLIYETWLVCEGAGGLGNGYGEYKGIGYDEQFKHEIKGIRPGAPNKKLTIIPIGVDLKDSRNVHGIRPIRSVALNTCSVMTGTNEYSVNEWLDVFNDTIRFLSAPIAMVKTVFDAKATTHLEYTEMPLKLYQNAYNLITNPLISAPIRLVFKGFISFYITKEGETVTFTHDMPENESADVGIPDYFNMVDDSSYSDEEGNWVKNIKVSTSAYDLYTMFKTLYKLVVNLIEGLVEDYTPKAQVADIVKLCLNALPSMSMHVYTSIVPYVKDTNTQLCESYEILAMDHNPYPKFILNLDNGYYAIACVDMTEHLSKYIFTGQLNIPRDSIISMLSVLRNNQQHTINYTQQMNNDDMKLLLNQMKEPGSVFKAIKNFKEGQQLIKTTIFTAESKRNVIKIPYAKSKEYAQRTLIRAPEETVESVVINGEDVGDNTSRSSYSHSVNMAMSMHTCRSSGSDVPRGNDVKPRKTKVDISDYIKELMGIREEGVVAEFITHNPCIFYDFETQNVGSRVFVYNFSIALYIPFIITPQYANELDVKDILAKLFDKCDVDGKHISIEDGYRYDNRVFYVNGITLDKETMLEGRVMEIFLFALSFLVKLAPFDMGIAHNGMKFDNYFIKSYEDAYIADKGSEKYEGDLHPKGSYYATEADINRLGYDPGPCIDRRCISTTFTTNINKSIIGKRKIQLVGTITTRNKGDVVDMTHVTLVDSRLITQAGSLKSFTNQYAPGEQGKGDLPHEVLVSDSLDKKKPFKEDIVKYAIQDSVCLAIAMFSYYEQATSIFKDVYFANTNTNARMNDIFRTGLNEFNTAMLKSPSSAIKQYLLGARVGVVDNPKCMYNWFRSIGYHGGCCNVSPEVQLGNIYTNINGFDITSAYPSIMAQKVPAKLVDILTNTGNDKELDDFIMKSGKHCFVFLKIEETSYEMKCIDGAIRTIYPMLRSSRHGLLLFSHMNPDKERTFKEATEINENDHLITANTYKYFRAIGYLKKYKIYGVFVYGEDTTLEPVVTALYRRKENADIKKAELMNELATANETRTDEINNELLVITASRATAKIVINTLYGYFGINKESFDKLGNYEFINDTKIACPIAAYCTAETTLRLYKFINGMAYLANKGLYTDTDSVYNQGYATAVEWVNAFYKGSPFDMISRIISLVNKYKVNTTAVNIKKSPFVLELCNDIVHFSLHCTKTIPEQLKGKELMLWKWNNSSGLGRWTIECSLTRMCIWWVKQYAYEATHGKDRGKLIIKSSGFRFKDNDKGVNTLDQYANKKHMLKQSYKTTSFIKSYTSPITDLKYIRDHILEMLECDESAFGMRPFYEDKDLEFDPLTGTTHINYEKLEAKYKKFKLETNINLVASSDVKACNLPKDFKKKLERKLKELNIILNDREVAFTEITKNFDVDMLWSSKKLNHKNGLVSYDNI